MPKSGDMPEGGDMPDRGDKTDLEERRASGLSFRRVVVGTLLAVLAFAITVQVTQKDDADYSGLRKGDLVELLRSLDSANERIASQVTDLTTTRNDLLSSSQLSAEAEAQAKKRADDLSILAGSAGAKGPGISVIISDPDKSIDAGALLDAIEELRDAGAEAIALNGTVRVVAQTYFLDSDKGIRVGGREIKRPFVIEAIGDPSTMETAVKFRGGLVDKVRNRGGTVDVSKSDKITITALADVKQPEYARPTP